jgi:hypothetical protein
MHETILRQIVSQRVITRQFSQEISHVRLMPPDQLAKSGSILSGYCPGDKITIFSRRQYRIRLSRDP